MIGDPKQAPIATRLMEKTLSSDDPGFISLVVLAEVAWCWQRLGYLAEQIDEFR